MEGIQSYAHLNEIIIQIIKESDSEITASQINDIILSKYKVGKVRINPIRIAKRIPGNVNIVSRLNKKGVLTYRHI
jgi:hypothetical protein